MKFSSIPSHFTSTTPASCRYMLYRTRNVNQIGRLLQLPGACVPRLLEVMCSVNQCFICSVPNAVTHAVVIRWGRIFKGIQCPHIRPDWGTREDARNCASLYLTYSNIGPEYSSHLICLVTAFSTPVVKLRTLATLIFSFAEKSRRRCSSEAFSQFPNVQYTFARQENMPWVVLKAASICFFVVSGSWGEM